MPQRKRTPLTYVQTIFPVGHFVLSVLFVICAGGLIVFACLMLWDSYHAVDAPLRARLDTVLDSLAVITVALAALELGQTILEEEVLREAQMSAPTRVRRFLSRFLVVLVVALVIEALVLVFRFSHSAPENLPYASFILLGAAALLLAWGGFIRMNRAAEELEPEAMREAKDEDRKVR